MKEIFNKYWHVFFGGGSAISFKGISDIAQTPEAIQAEEVLRHYVIMEPTEAAKYFLIGLLGTVAGIIGRVIWGIIKRKFPSLHGIDK